MGHIHKDYDFTVSTFIVFNQKVLLLHHKKLDIWLQPGGHIELDEDPIMALWREVEEETGLGKSDLELISPAKKHFADSRTEKELPLPFNLNVHNYDATHKHIDMCYLMRAKHGKFVHNLEETHDIKWFAKDELDELKSLPKVIAKAKYAIDTLRG